METVTISKETFEKIGNSLRAHNKKYFELGELMPHSLRVPLIAAMEAVAEAEQQIATQRVADVGQDLPRDRQRAAG